ncbi:hypothetical protein I4U23_019205 [Adineta vaga]|nr:hypothetical protein I4U23_019205 [Adineta vaga]
MSSYQNTDWQKSVAFAFTSGGLFGYLLRSIRPIAIFTSVVAGAALGSLVTYEYFDTEQKTLANDTLSQVNNLQSNPRQQYEYFRE